jgi:hypothetical protein
MSKPETPAHWPENHPGRYLPVEMTLAQREAWRLGYAASEEYITAFKGEIPEMLEVAEARGREKGIEEAARWHDSEALGLDSKAAKTLVSAGAKFKARVEAEIHRLNAQAIRTLLKKGA